MYGDLNKIKSGWLLSRLQPLLYQWACLEFFFPFRFLRQGFFVKLWLLEPVLVGQVGLELPEIHQSLWDDGSPPLAVCTVPSSTMPWKRASRDAASQWAWLLHVLWLKSVLSSTIQLSSYGDWPATIATAVRCEGLCGPKGASLAHNCIWAHTWCLAASYC